MSRTDLTCRKCGAWWTPENTYRRPSNPDQRECRNCSRIRRDEWMERNPEKVREMRRRDRERKRNAARRGER